MCQSVQTYFNNKHSHGNKKTYVSHTILYLYTRGLAWHRLTAKRTGASHITLWLCGFRQHLGK
jgi:hypothetical protein